MPFTKESLFYREIFEKYYHDQSRTIVDFWMPNKAWPGCKMCIRDSPCPGSNSECQQDHSIFFSSSYTNWTLVPMMTWQAFLLGRMTPAAPAAFTAFSSTLALSRTSKRRRVAQ